MIYEAARCRFCESVDLSKYGMQNGNQRCKCNACGRVFKLTYTYRACEPGVKEQMVEMALNGSGIRDTARVLSVAKGTVISELKKRSGNLHRQQESGRSQFRGGDSLLQG
jgi:transposase